MSRPSRYGRMGHSFDSESIATSALTSPPLSPREFQLGHHRALGVVAHGDPVAQPYYVQSPSRDSFCFNEVDSLSHSFAAKSLSPPGSPLASPLHHKSFSSKTQQQQQQAAHHQQQAAAGYYAGNPRPGSRRVLPQPSNVATAAAAAGPPRVVSGAQKPGYQPWNGVTIREEEESNQGLYGRRGISRWCAVFLSIIFAILCIVIVGFTYWLVCRPSAPRVQVKRIEFQSFSIAEGDDDTGVPTQVLTLNFNTTIEFANPSKYFGFHVSAPDVQLFYQQIMVAEGMTDKFFQKKRSKGVIYVGVHAMRNPVYGAGPNLLSSFTSGNGLPLVLHVDVQSEAHVIWKFVRPRYKSNIACDLILDTNGTSASTTGLMKILDQDCHRG